jgi:hypothetical protein
MLFYEFLKRIDIKSWKKKIKKIENIKVIWISKYLLILSEINLNIEIRIRKWITIGIHLNIDIKKWRTIEINLNIEIRKRKWWTIEIHLNIEKRKWKTIELNLNIEIRKWITISILVKRFFRKNYKEIFFR